MVARLMSLSRIAGRNLAMLARPDRLSLLTTAAAVVVATCARDESVAVLVANVEIALAVEADMYRMKCE